MKPRVRKLYLLGVTVLVVASLLTGVQGARAYTPPCDTTSYHKVMDCGRCGLAYWYKYHRTTYTWVCVDGTSGTYQERGVCKDCGSGW